MRNKKLKLALSELEKEMEVISREEMKSFKGGGSGTEDDPYTYDEYLNFLESGHFGGGYVEGMGTSGNIGYVDPETIHLGEVSTLGTTNDWDEIYKNFWFNAQKGMFPNDEISGISGSLDPYGDSGWYDVSGVSGYYDNNNGGGGGSGGESHHYYTPKKGDPLKDGIDLKKKNILIDTSITKKEGLNNQLKEILSSNSIIKNILGQYNKGQLNLRFNSKKLVSKKRAAETDYNITENTAILTLNTDFIQDGSWRFIKGVDNIDYDYGKAQNAEECLVITITHESLHAKHLGVFYDACREFRNDRTAVANFLGENYSSDFRNIFMENINGKWEFRTNGVGEKMHDYMRKYDHSVIDAALEEYRREHP